MGLGVFGADRSLTTHVRHALFGCHNVVASFFHFGCQNRGEGAPREALGFPGPAIIPKPSVLCPLRGDF